MVKMNIPWYNLTIIINIDIVITLTEGGKVLVYIIY